MVLVDKMSTLDSYWAVLRMGRGTAMNSRYEPYVICARGKYKTGLGNLALTTC